MSSRILFLDLETFAETPITYGTHRYAEEAEILLAALAWDDGPVEVLDFTVDALTCWSRVQGAIAQADRVVVHNSHFDRTVLRHQGIEMPAEKIDDTMVQALAHSLPGSLDKLCAILSVPHDKAKDAEGKKLIQLFCKPRPTNQKLRRATRETHPDDWAKFKAYAGNDIEAMREIRKRLPTWNFAPPAPGANDLPFERRVWELDQKINDRGVQIDLELANAAVRAAAAAQARLAKHIKAATNDEVASATQRARVLKYLQFNLGLEIDDLKGGTIDMLLKDSDLPVEVREVLQNRSQAAATSPAKYKVLQRGVNKDGRLRGTTQYCGAMRTGRWGGRLFQPQNLPRPGIGNLHDEDLQELIDRGIEAMKAGVEDLVFDDLPPGPNDPERYPVMEVITSAVRGAIVAKPGHKLLVADLANIEGRMLSWLAGEEWKLEAFRAYDRGEGPDLYKVTAGTILGKSPHDVTKDERQVQGKVPDLACLLEGTLVLTVCGEKPIEEVLPGDLVWDGAAWVPTDGPVYKGEKHVISYDGLCATPDHLVWVEGQAHPVELGHAARNGFRLVRSGPRDEAVTPRRRQTADRGSATVHEPEGQGLQELRCEGGGISLCDGGRGLRLGAGEPGSSAGGASARSTGQRRPLREGEPALVDAGGELLAHPAQQARGGMAPFSGDVPHGEVRRLYAAQSAGAGPDLRGNRGAVDAAQLQTKRRVWDLLNCGPLHRFTASGRLVHNCGYQGSVGAFAAMGAVYGVVLPEEEALRIVRGWRDRHPATRKLWYATDDAAKAAIGLPGEVFRAGKLAFRRDGAWLRMRLPSGRYLCYPRPRMVGGLTVCEVCIGAGYHLLDADPEDEFCDTVRREPCEACGGVGHIDLGRVQITYEGVDQYTRQWKRQKTYGGKLVENATQAASRDVFAWWMLRAEEMGYPVVLHVHDELLCEVPDTPDYTVEGLIACLGEGPEWAQGLPLAAAGFSCYRYKKD